MVNFTPRSQKRRGSRPSFWSEVTARVARLELGQIPAPRRGPAKGPSPSRPGLRRCRGRCALARLLHHGPHAFRTGTDSLISVERGLEPLLPRGGEEGPVPLHLRRHELQGVAHSVPARSMPTTPRQRYLAAFPTRISFSSILWQGRAENQAPRTLRTPSPPGPSREGRRPSDVIEIPLPPPFASSD